jgi:hypothetical protein
LELRALCLPFSGVLTGELLPKHIQKLTSTLDDIEEQCSQGLASGIQPEELLAALKAQIFSSPTRDPVLIRAMDRSKEALLTQLLSPRPSK